MTRPLQDLWLDHLSQEIGVLVCLSAAALSTTRLAAAPTFETVHAFSTTPGTPSLPQGKLLQAKDGNFYGVTSHGGSGDMGTVFKMTPDGTVTTLVNFTGSNGSFPLAGLLQGKDGYFYGTTSEGGAFHFGTVFRMNAYGELLTLAQFNKTNGSSPQGELMQEKDGNFYGTTSAGGNRDSIGTVFRMTPNGMLGTLVNFKKSIGLAPKAGMIQATDGYIYGTTSTGGGFDCGTIFKMTQDGNLVTFEDFSGDSGDSGDMPLGGLIQARDGNFYGTTLAGGTPGRGTIYRMSPGGSLLTLFQFTDHTFSSPGAGLVQGDDGNFYGTTTNPANTDSAGTVFQITPTGQLTKLTDFSQPEEAASEFGTLIRGSDGNLYGTTTAPGNATTGEAATGGQIFRLRMEAAQAPEITVLSPTGASLTSGAGSVSFGSIKTTASNSLVFKIGNTGSADLTGLSLKIDGANASDFAITSSPVSPVRGPEGTTTFTIKFSPKAAGARAATLHISSNDANENPFNIALKGNGIVLAPEISVMLAPDRDLVDGVSKEKFGTVKLGKTSKARIFTIKNIGTAKLTDLKITEDGLDRGQFILSLPAKKSLEPGASTTFKISFKPTTKGTRTAAIHIFSNDKDESPFDIKLTGSGAKP